MESEIPGVKEKGILNSRDYVMWRYAYYALQAIGLQADECAVVEGHWLHLNKRNGGNFLYPSLGYYLKQYYGQGYCSIGLLAGEGTYATYRYTGERFVTDTLEVLGKMCPGERPELFLLSGRWIIAGTYSYPVRSGRAR